MLDQAGLAERHHLRRRVGYAEQTARGFVDSCIGRLSRQDDGDQESERVPMLKLASRLWVRLRETAENLLDLGSRQPSRALGPAAVRINPAARRRGRF